MSHFFLQLLAYLFFKEKTANSFKHNIDENAKTRS